MKLLEVLDDIQLRVLMSLLLQKAGFKPFFAAAGPNTIIKVPMNSESYVRLSVKDDMWRAVLMLKTRHVAAAQLAPEEVIPWIEKLGYKK